MKKKISNIILVAVFLTGLSLLLYPSVSNYWNSLHSSYALVGYAEELANLSNEEYEAILENAHAYNARMTGSTAYSAMTDEEIAEYQSQLRLSNSDVMGYLEISAINCRLPIYHGTDDSVLQVGVGHLEWSSLPVGGEGTHCLLSGHRGLPSARLFTDLDQLAEGDSFQITVLGETLTYEIDQIRIVLPEDVDELLPVPGKDYCTLITCTPYGVNTHRMLVRGTRVENPEELKSTHVVANAMQIEPILIAPIFASVILLILLICMLVRDHRKKKH